MLWSSFTHMYLRTHWVFANMSKVKHDNIRSHPTIHGYGVCLQTNFIPKKWFQISKLGFHIIPNILKHPNFIPNIPIEPNSMHIIDMFWYFLLMDFAGKFWTSNNFGWPPGLWSPSVVILGWGWLTGLVNWVGWVVELDGALVVRWLY